MSLPPVTCCLLEPGAVRPPSLASARSPCADQLLLGCGKDFYEDRNPGGRDSVSSRQHIADIRGADSKLPGQAPLADAVLLHHVVQANAGLLLLERLNPLYSQANVTWCRFGHGTETGFDGNV